MDIGKPQRVFIIEPAENPVPERIEVPLEPSELPQTPVEPPVDAPVEAPADAPDHVPA